MIKRMTVAASIIAASLGVDGARAADLIEGYYPPARHARTVARVVPVDVVDCSLLRVDYRAPNPPRAEIVRVCYPPLDLSPRSAVNRRGQFIGINY